MDGGETDCYRCDGKDEDCWICEGHGLVDYYGAPEDFITGSFDDWATVVWMVWSLRKRGWTPRDLERQSAWFMDAYFYLIGRVLHEIRRLKKQAENASRQET